MLSPTDHRRSGGGSVLSAVIAAGEEEEERAEPEVQRLTEGRSRSVQGLWRASSGQDAVQYL